MPPEAQPRQRADQAARADRVDHVDRADRVDRVAEASRLWRHQLVLVGAAVLVGLAAVGLLAVSLGLAAHGGAGSAPSFGADGRLHAPAPGWTVIPAIVGAVALTAVLVGAVIHTVRVATFAFRRHDQE